MPKVSLDPPKHSAVKRKTRSARSDTPGLNLEKRLQDARLKRQQALSAQNSAAPAAADDVPEPAAEAEKPAPPSEHEQAAPSLRAKTSNKTARNAILAFSLAAGMGFGVVLGVGVLSGAGQLPDPSADVAPARTETPAAVMTQELDGPVEMVAHEQETPDEVFSVALDRPKETQPSVTTDEPASPVVEPMAAPDLEPARGPEIFSVTSQPAELDVPAIPLVAWPAFDVDRPEERALIASAPDLFQPERPGGLSTTQTFGDGPAPGLQYFMHVPTGVSAANLQGLVSRLDQSGVKVAEIGRENFRVSATHIRFYSPDTAEAARTVAAELGVEARDFSQNFVDTERIEIWVAGRPGSQSAARGSRNVSSSTPPYNQRNGNC